MKKIKTIGVLTSGGDAPGMNAAIRAVTRSAICSGYKVMGIMKGYEGLMKGEMNEMSARNVSDIIYRGGTILKTARAPEFKTKEGLQKAADMADAFDIDALVVIGGDGSYRGAKDISEYGLKVVGLPGTIDNDIASTSYTIGFDTASNTILDAIDKIKDTAFSHERCSVVEVMGRRAGHLAVNVAIAGGAELAIIPEKKFDFKNDVVRQIIEARNRGKSHYIIVVAEGAANGMEIAEKLESLTGIETRATILGHIQRGGSPTSYDRVMASRMGNRAIEVLNEGRYNRIIGYDGEKLNDYDIIEALDMEKSIRAETINLAETLAL